MSIKKIIKVLNNDKDFLEAFFREPTSMQLISLAKQNGISISFEKSKVIIPNLEN